jgi:hypothetical protein
VFIKDRGRPSYVLLSIDEYRRLTGTDANIVDLLIVPGAEDIELDLPLPRNLPDAPDLG